MIDAAAANSRILKSPTTLRLEDGTFYGWEGCHPTAGSCEGSCTHVWNYQQALPFLYPALERSMREADYKYNLNPAGGLSFRLSLPLGTNYDDRAALRRWSVRQHPQALPRLEAERATRTGCKRLWPAAKRSIEYAWSPDNPDRWDPEQTGVLWGRQHHTLDMELFGPNSWLTGFYLGRAEGRRRDGRGAWGGATPPTLYRGIYQRGRGMGRPEPVQRRVFRPADRSVRPSDPRALYAKGEKSQASLAIRSSSSTGAANTSELKYQLGGACLIDQALGQWHAELYGLGDILDREKVATSLRSIYANNFVTAGRHLQSLPGVRDRR